MSISVASIARIIYARIHLDHRSNWMYISIKSNLFIGTSLFSIKATWPRAEAWIQSIEMIGSTDDQQSIIPFQSI